MLQPRSQGCNVTDKSASRFEFGQPQAELNSLRYDNAKATTDSVPLAEQQPSTTLLVSPIQLMRVEREAIMSCQELIVDLR